MSWQAKLCIAATILLWGSAFTGITIGLEGFSPGALALVRFATASAALLVAVRLVKLPVPARRDLPQMALLGAIGIAAYHLMLNMGQRTVAPGTSAFLIQTAPIFTAALAWRFLGERLGSLGLLGFAVALTGTVLLILGTGEGLSFSMDALLIVGSAVATSVYFVFQRNLVLRYGALSVTAWTIVLGTVPLLAFLPAAVVQWPAAPVASRVAAVFIGLFPAALAYALWNRAIREVGPQRAVSFLYIAPVIAMLTAWLWYGTLPSWLSITGGVVALAGVALVQWERQIRASGAAMERTVEAGRR